jgi:hypothetical protein
VSESLGKAVLDLEANLEPLETGMKRGRSTVNEMQHSLDALAAVSNMATEQLQKIRMKADQAAETAGVSDKMKRSLAGISAEAERARADIERVKIGAGQAAESTAAGDRIERKLKGITGEANEARRAVESVRLAGMGAGGAGGGGGFVPGGGGGGNPGVGVGPFGSGFGRIGLLGAAIGGGTLLGPAAGPGALGLLAAIPVLATSGAGALGTLALAFQGVGKAIGGDKKAFDDLGKSAQGFVLTVRSLDGWFDKLKETAGASMFPGLTTGLKSALSPGTLAAITTAVQQFGHAIGVAGVTWGRYFGSAEFQSIFGPLMASGAHNLILMSSAALHLTDAIGVLGRAAIPLTSWMVQGIDAGSRWASSWMRAKEATGGLGHAMDEAKTSLQLVGGLLASLLHAVGALGGALYPVSKVAVKDLTDGLNALAGIIERNKQTIRDVVGGALAAFVATVKAAAGVVRTLWPLLAKVADLLGGWKTTFEILIGLKIASLVNGWAMSFAKLAGMEALGGASLQSGTLLANLTKLKLLGPIAISIAIMRQILGSGTGWDLSEPTAADVVRGDNPYPVGSSLADAWAAGRSGKKTFQGHVPQPAAANGGDFGTPQGLPANLLAAFRAGAAAAKKTGGGSSSTSSTFTGSVQGESSTLVAALEGLSKYYDSAKINVISGARSTEKQQALWDASVRAGHPGRMPNGNPIARPGTSPHESGNALDGTIMIKGKAVPLSSLPQSVLARFGLETVAGDVNHVQLAAGATGDTTSPFGAEPPWTKNVPKPKKIPWKGATEAAIITAKGRVAAILEALPDALDATELNAVRHIEALRDKLHIHMSAADLAKDKVELAKWGKVLHTEILANARKAAEAAAYTKDLFNRALSLDMSHVLRDQQRGFREQSKAFNTETSRHLKDMQTAFSEQSKAFNTETSRTIKDMQVAFGIKSKAFNTETSRTIKDMQVAFSRQLKEFDEATKLGLGKLAAPAQTPAEKAYADFLAKRAASDLAKSRADQLANAATPEEKAALALGFSLDDQQVALQTAADASRVAADLAATDAQARYQDQRDALRQAMQDKQTDLEQAYQDQRTTQLQAMQDLETDAEQAYQDQRTAQLNALGEKETDLENAYTDLRAKQWEKLEDLNVDQATKLQDNLNDWTVWIGRKKKKYSDFLEWAAGQGIDTGSLVDPGQETAPGGTVSTGFDFQAAGGARFVAPGTVAAMAAAGRRITHQLPKLDVGGYVEQTGVAVVHEGETWSGVGANRMTGEDHVHFHGGTFIGGNKQQVARELKPYLDKVLGV